MIIVVILVFGSYNLFGEFYLRSLKNNVSLGDIMVQK